MKTTFDHASSEFSTNEKREGRLQDNTETIIEVITWIVLASLIFFF